METPKQLRLLVVLHKQMHSDNLTIVKMFCSSVCVAYLPSYVLITIIYPLYIFNYIILFFVNSIHVHKVLDFLPSSFSPLSPSHPMPLAKGNIYMSY